MDQHQPGSSARRLVRDGFQKLTLQSRILGLVLLTGYALVFLSQNVFHSSTVVDNLGLVAGRTIPFGYNVVTYAFVEDSFLSLLWTLPTAVFIVHALDPIQGSQGTGKIILVTVAASGILTFITLSMTYYILIVSGMGDGDDASMLYTPLCGFQGAISGLIVALKQAIPESDVTLATSIRFKMKYAPLIYIVGVSLVSLVSGMMLKYVPFVVFGWYAAWLYLRHFHRMPDSGLYGDPSDQFRFASFFPERMQPAVSVIASACYVMFKVGSWGRPRPSASNNPMEETSWGSESAVDAARRRERGMKALEERLNLNSSDDAMETGARTDEGT
eukprot:jgi/Picre1/32016/NNA_007364.t1